MSDNKTVWCDQGGDLRKKTNKLDQNEFVNITQLILNIRRLTSGKGRTVIEISELPNNTKWCQSLAKTLKKSLGVGGTYKNRCIEIHGEKLDLVTQVLDKKQIKWKKTGG